MTILGWSAIDGATLAVHAAPQGARANRVSAP
jgi:hypothetical protein